MKESIKRVLDAGLEVTNSKGDYIRMLQENKYIFQTHRDMLKSNVGTFDDMLKLFLQESNIIDTENEDDEEDF